MNKDDIQKFITESESPSDTINEILEWIHEVDPMNQNPVSLVKWVDVNKVKANDYNPNSVAKKEMQLLYTSIKHDGYTQPIVTIYDKSIDKYVIIDGFHRYFVGLTHRDVLTDDRLPVVVLEKSINDRMASTIRHNRARGEHSVDGMSDIVFEMMQNGWSDADICNELGMEAEELLKLKYVTGYAKLYDGIEYNKSWKTRIQVELEKKYRDGKK